MAKKEEKMVEGKSAGDAGAAQMVKLVANPRLHRGCRGRVIVTVDGVARAFMTDEPVEVPEALADKLTTVEVRGYQAVVRA